MEYWSDLYEEIADKANKNLAEIEWIDLWHEQVSYLTAELPFPTPALFLAFSLVGADDRGALVQDCNTQIDMYLFFETLSDTYFGSANKDRAIDYLRTLTRLNALFHGKNGKNYSEMRRVDMQRIDSGDAGNLYRISFQCLVTDYSAQLLFNETENPDAELEIKKGDIPEEPQSPPMYDLE